MGTLFTKVRMVCWVCVLAAPGCQKEFQRDEAGHQREAGSKEGMPRVEATIELTGPGLSQPRTFAFEQLAAMEMTRIDNVMMLQSHGPDEITGWRGPSLDVLLAAAGVKPGPMVLAFEATDGYGLDTSRQELGPAIVALQDGDGRWLAEIDRTCPLRLVVPDKPANYWIMNLQKITVEPQGGAGVSP